MNSAVAFILTHEPDPSRTGYGNSMQALALVRSLGRRGVAVVRLHPNHRERSLLSRYCSTVETCPSIYGSEEQLLQFLLVLADRYEGPRVLLPASDDAAFFLGKHRERLRPRFEVPVPSASAIAQIIDKRLQYREAERLGIPIPETYFPQSAEEVQRLARELKGPQRRAARRSSLRPSSRRTSTPTSGKASPPETGPAAHSIPAQGPRGRRSL